MREWKIFLALAVVFLIVYFLPLANGEVTAAILEAFKLLQWYARNHTLACVVPALFIARGHLHLSREVGRAPVSRAAVEQACGLRSGFRIRDDSRRLLVQRAADVRRHLPARRRDRAGG